MNRLAPALVLFAALSLPFLGCGSDPASPGTALWSRATLPDLPVGATLFDLAFDGSRGVAVGAIATPGETDEPEVSPLVLETEDGMTWTRATTTAPDNTALLGVVLTASGYVAVGGVTGKNGIGTPLILDMRGGDQVITPTGDGALNAIAATGDRLVAVGVADGGMAFASPLGSVSWNPEDMGFTTPQEKGLTDIEFSPSSNRLFATGWDDGGPPYPVLKRNDSPGVWTDLLAAPGGSGSPSQRLAVWEVPSGTVYVGGSFEGAEPLDFRARLDMLTDDGWIALVLPENRTLGSVNDIHGDGSALYLACGTSTASLMGPGTSTSFVVEFRAPGRAISIARGPGNTLHAVALLTENGTPRPAILIRQPTTP